MNYYNEYDPYAAQWLRNLIAAELIPAGHVDERSIKEVQPDDLEGFTQCHFFAGIGGWSLALEIAGWPDEVAVWTGSCPCQPFSQAGNRKGEADERHLWPDFHCLIAECRPAIIFGEQVASADGREWLTGVRVDMETLEYAFGAADLCSAGKAAPCLRQRLWWMADAYGSRWDARSQERQECGEAVSQVSATRGEVCRLGIANGTGSQPRWQAGQTVGHGSPAVPAGGVDRMGNTPALRRPWGNWASEQEQGTGPRCTVAKLIDGSSRRIEPSAFPLVAGIPRNMGRGRSKRRRMEIGAARANRVGRLKGYGNAINPWVAAEFIAASMETRAGS